MADGALRVAISLMAAEASNVLARRGVDAPQFRMVAFGGAGPLMGALLAEELAIDSVLIPPFPGALSALGAARADLEGDLVEPVYERLGDLPARSLAAAAERLQATGAATGSPSNPPPSSSPRRGSSWPPTCATTARATT